MKYNLVKLLLIGQILNLDHYYRIKFYFSIYQLKLIK